MKPLHLLARMNATGIGFAGVDGAWWQPAVNPYPLPHSLHDTLKQIQTAVFLLLDSVGQLMQANEPTVTGLLTYRVPPAILRLLKSGQVQALRPDFQLSSTPTGLQPVATELEIAPSAHGFTHAMQVGYELEPDLVQTFGRFLNGRPLLMAGTHQWSAFMFEQLAFCKSLHESGARGYVLYDKSLTQLQAEALSGALWQLPMFGIEKRPPGWHPDIETRLEKYGLRDFWWPQTAVWPQDVGNAVVFRFGYFDTFSHQTLQTFARWQAEGATFLNPLQFIFDSKVILAALQLPAVRQAIVAQAAPALAILDRCIPQTHLLTPKNAANFAQEKDRWVLKFAGFDGSNQSWGGLSLAVGANQTQNQWTATLSGSLALSWPVVVQRLAPSSVEDVKFYGRDGSIKIMRNGRSRLRVFFVRDYPPCGAHVTFSSNTLQVSESVTAVQAPVAWQGKPPKG